MNEREDGNRFHVLDYVVFSATLAISAGIGIYFRFSGGKQRTNKEYLLGGQSMSALPVAFSLMASFMSSITLLGVSSENYMYGTQFVLINISYIIATPLAAYGFLPVFFKLQATSAYQYLELRFSRPVRQAASVAFILQMTLYMGIVLYAPALALNAVTGLSKVGSILAVGLVCTFYSTIGGMKAVLIADVFQSLLMFSAVICVAVKGSLDAGGVKGVLEIADEGLRLQAPDFRIDPKIRHTVWTQVFGGIFTFLSLYGVNQAQIQRLLTVKSLKKSQASLWLNWPILTALSLITSYAGLSIYSEYAYCDPLLTKRITNSDQLLPLFVVDTMGNLPGIPGLFVAGIFSGSLSTVSSAVNSLAAVTIEDFLKTTVLRNTSEKKITLFTKLIALLFGFICLGVAFLAQFLGGILQASLTIFGVVGGPLLGLFTLGMFSTTAESVGALSGLFTGLAFALWIGFGGPKPPIPVLPQSTDGCEAANTTASLLTKIYMSTSPLPTNYTESTESPVGPIDYFPLYEISYMWYAPIGFATTLIVGLCISAIYRMTKSGIPDVSSNYLSPLYPKCYRPKDDSMSLVDATEVQMVPKTSKTNIAIT
ncbi:putative sodium-dependent multivitamin transporter [Artemia franciscana]|uniref:Sodium-dependent multivitamin transporter n=1 Tax=Artemia franciscana TaxID=6661 RepID=A0AA88HNJ1_ARTSF|nr:hypothetical protein QYM36_013870 [Artemia franciscana]